MHGLKQQRRYLSSGDDSPARGDNSDAKTETLHAVSLPDRTNKQLRKPHRQLLRINPVNDVDVRDQVGELIENQSLANNSSNQCCHSSP